jgi:hypothetical protein
MTSVYIEIDQLGSKFYYKDKAMTILHREDGPAIERSNGDKAWYINGKRHREDGPAYEGADGESWIINGLYHREDGPAIVWRDGTKSWAINGERISEREFLLKTAKEIILTMDEIADKFGVDVSKLKIAK